MQPTLSAAYPVVSGTITDAETGEGLLGVNIQLAEALRGTSTDINGHYRLVLPQAGSWTLRVTHISYRSQTLTISVTDSLTQNFQLVADYLQTDEVIITAQARESTARLSTTKVDVIRAPEIQARAPGTLDRVLDAVPGVEVHRTGGAVVSNVSIRGSSDMLGGGVGNRTLLLVDGKPAIISDTDGASWWLYPDDIIERVEVVKGAYSALYGSNAMGGVINLITRKPSHREYTRIHAGYGMFERPPAWMRYTEKASSLSNLSFSHSNYVGRLGYFTNFTRRASDGWRQGSAYNNISAFSKLKYDYTPTSGISLSTLYLTGENDYPHAWESTAAPLKIKDIYTNDLQRKQSVSTDLVYSRLESPNSSYTLRFFYNRDLTRSILNPDSDPREGDVDLNFQTRSISQKFGLLEHSSRLLPYNNTVVFGAEAVWDIVDGQPETYLYGRQNIFSPAVFAQNDYSPHKKVHFTLGGRLDYRNLIGRKTSTMFSPKAGVSYEALKNLVLRSSVGQAFRNPSIAEMFLRRVGTQDYEFIPNPDLDPERVDFGEAGFYYTIDDIMVFDGAAFYYDYTDVIRWQTIAGGRYHTENLSNAIIKGCELGMKSSWPKRFRSSAQFTYLNTDIDNQGPLTYVPEWRFFIGASYEFDHTTVSASLRSVAQTDSVIFYQNDAPGAFTLLDLRVAFNVRQSTSLSLICDNVFDTYYEEMERYRMPPRTYRVDLLYEFDITSK
ncbi:TonB-dependent receptor [bacterium]|nr:TonB-dependent receptor [bacterium]